VRNSGGTFEAQERRKGSDALSRLLVVLALVVVVACVPRPEANAERPRTDHPLDSEVWSTHWIHFVQVRDTLLIQSAEDRRVLTVLPPGEGGFARGIVRPLMRERARADVQGNPAIALRIHGGDAWFLDDPSTGLRVDLAAFGSGSLRDFSALVRSSASP
jgi:putative photosynthetic complex assembly protein